MPVVVEYDEQGVAPCPSVIVPHRTDAFERRLIAGVKAIGSGLREEFVACPLRPDSRVVRLALLVVVEQRCLLVVAVEQEDRRRLTHLPEEEPLKFVPRSNGLLGDLAQCSETEV